MRLKYGLQARFQVMAIFTLAVILALVMVLLLRQWAMQREVVVLGQKAMHAVVFERMRERSEAAVSEAADALVNPLYYFDTDAIGAITRNLLRQPDVRYVMVFDPQGNIIHDGSGDIPSYGQTMRDPMAAGAIAANAAHVQQNAQILDVASPIRVGEERLGGLRVGYSLEGVVREETRAADALGASLRDAGQRHLIWVGLLLALLTATALVASFLVQRGLVLPIRRLAQAAGEIEAGNYGASVPQSRREDEIGTLLQAFSRMGEGVARHNRDIRRMAYTDALTGLANRLAFREHLDARLMQMRGIGHPLALLFADMDDFKRVNDSMGHDVGDEVLIQFGARIQETVERIAGEDALLARFGGDEFVMLLESDPNGDRSIQHLARGVAEALVEALSQPFVIDGRELFLGTSIGITLFPQDASGATALLKNGDIAMYQAKLAGKHCYRFYSQAMEQASTRLVQLEQEFRGAWERGELSVLYQPIFRLADRRLVGAEALLRWQHPSEGAIAPAVFIEVAEQTGLIDQIGAKVLHTACHDAASWHTPLSGHQPLFVSVNLSARQLRNERLPEQVNEILRAARLPASRLHLELTETAVLGNEQQTGAMLERLREYGVRIWLDDFGTGFSGLSHLRRVPVDGVKIDRSFIADILRDPDDLALTSAIISMAHSLGITVVGEGVEKEGQYDLLRQRGCDFAQGFWLGLPMVAEEFSRLLEHARTTH